jgi:hypothetical protein
LIVANGNVGIGTEPPNNGVFEIEGGSVGGGTNAGAIIIHAQNAFSGSGGNITLTPGTSAWGNKGTIELDGGVTIGGYAGVAFPSKDQVLIGEDGTYPNGNLGINTSLPNASLAVRGGAVIGYDYAGRSFSPTNQYFSGGGEGMIVAGPVGIGTYSSALSGNIAPGSAMLAVGSYNSGTGIWSGAAIGNYAGVNSPPSNGLIISGNVGLGTYAPSSGLQMQQSFALYTTEVSSGSAFTTSGQTYIGVTNSTSTAVTITLSTADTVNGRLVLIKDEGGGAAIHNITINCQGSQTIDGVSSVSIVANYGIVKVISESGNWFTL